MEKIEFLKFHSGYYGETVDSIGQIVKCTFTGQELFEYLTAFASKKNDVKVNRIKADNYGDGFFKLHEFYAKNGKKPVILELFFNINEGENK